MIEKILLAEARALIIQLFARGGYKPGGTTQKQVNDLIQRIDRTVYP